MTISAAHVQARFDQSEGLDPIFRTNDGSNCDHNIDVSTLAGRSAAYSLLRTRGLIRIALAVPATRDFDVVSVTNPYGCNEANVISMYRRPLPATNLKFLSTLMFDGRESSTQTGTTPITSGNYPQSLLDDLAHQSVDATLGHAQGLSPGPTTAQQQAIVAFETALYTAQAEDHGVGSLTSLGAKGGPHVISDEGFYIGINDPVGLDPANPVPFNFSTKIFNTFDAWKNIGVPSRQAIARGQAIFNTKTFTITGVAGLNGTTFPNGVIGPDTIVSTCGICHDTPNAGNHSVSAPLNIGVADPPGGNNPLDTSYRPIIIVATREALRTIPSSIREAAYAAGATKWQTIWYHLLPYSLGGIATGTIIAMSRAIGETAPLLVIGAAGYISRLPPPPITATPPFVSFAWLNSSFTVLPMQMYNWTADADPALQSRAATTGLVLIVLTLSINAAAIALRYRVRKKLKW
jgi:hypothetical protein